METVLHTAAFKNIELSLSSVVRWKAVFPDQHFSSCPSYLLLRLNSWRVQLRGGVPVLSLSTPPPPPPRDRGSTMDMAPWKIEEPQLPSPWPLGCRFYSGRGKLRIAGAAVLLSPQQALKAVSPREKHGIVFVPRAQIVPRGTSKPYSRDL